MSFSLQSSQLWPWYSCLVVCLLAVDLESPLPVLSPALQWCALWLWIWNFLDLPCVFCLLRNGFILAMELESPCAFACSALMCVLVGDLESRHHVILLILQWYAVWLWIWNFPAMPGGFCSLCSDQISRCGSEIFLCFCLLCGGLLSGCGSGTDPVILLPLQWCAFWLWIWNHFSLCFCLLLNGMLLGYGSGITSSYAIACCMGVAF